MARNKTQPTGASIEAYLDARASAEQRSDCRALMAMLKRVTGHRPHMWGPSIVGYGSYRYTYDSGHSGAAPLVGFAIRGRDLVVYVSVEAPDQQARLAKLGPHRMGKSCLYFRRLADLDPAVFEQLVAASVAAVQRRWGPPDPGTGTRGARHRNRTRGAAVTPTPDLRPVGDLPDAIGRTAARALALHGITTRRRVARHTKRDLLAIHGVGPKAVTILAQALAAEGLDFRTR